MSEQIRWSAVADAEILEMRAAGLTWPRLAARLNVGRNAVIERARRLGLPPVRPPIRHAVVTVRIDRPPLPPGHPVSWSAITDGTALHGKPYPHPVFF